MNMGLSFLQNIGRSVLGVFVEIGALCLFFGKILACLIKPPYYFRTLLQNLFIIGYLSLPVVGLTAIFTGAVLALQVYAGGARFNAVEVVPSIVSIGMVRELGPVLVGLMVAGRVGASIAAEIGTMKVTEQIDALTMLSTDPIRYLALPRLLAAVICLPLLVLVCDSIGIFGGYLVGTYMLGFNEAIYVSNAIAFLQPHDIISGMIKASVFGALIAISGCFYGMNSARGASGVGHATTQAVVAASIAILTANYLLTSLFHS